MRRWDAAREWRKGKHNNMENEQAAYEQGLDTVPFEDLNKGAEVSQINYPTNELAYAASIEDEGDENDCEFCDNGKVENARGFMVPCQECSVDTNNGD